MAFNPINLIKKGASGLIEQGKDFFNAAKDINQKVIDTKTKIGDIFASTRGYEQLNKPKYGTTKSGQKFELPFKVPEKTTIKESITATPKYAAETFTGLGRLGELALNKFGTTPGRDKPDLQRIAEKYVQTKTGGLLADTFGKIET